MLHRPILIIRPLVNMHVESRHLTIFACANLQSKATSNVRTSDDQCRNGTRQYNLLYNRPMSSFGCLNSNLVCRLTVASVTPLQGWQVVHERSVVRSCEPFKFRWAPIISVERLQVELSRRSTQVLSTYVDCQCDKLMTVVGHQFITLFTCVYSTVGVSHRSRGSISDS